MGGGDQGAIGPGHPRAGCAPLEHGELVAQDQDLDVLGGVGSSAQHDPAQDLVNIWQVSRSAISGSCLATCRVRTGRSRLCAPFWAPTGSDAAGTFDFAHVDTIFLRLWVPETARTDRDLPVRQRQVPGMIR